MNLAANLLSDLCHVLANVGNSYVGVYNQLSLKVQQSAAINRK